MLTIPTLPIYQGPTHKKLTLLQQDELETLANVVPAIESAADLFAGGKKHLEKYDTIKDALNTQSLAAARKAVDWLKVNKSNHTRVWSRQDTAATLNDKATWDIFKNRAASEEDRDAIESIQIRWAYVRKLTALNSDALSKVAFEYIPVVEDFCEALDLELRYYGTRIPKKNREAARAYRAELVTWVKKAREVVADAMTARLITASQTGDMYCDDACNFAVRELKRLGALPDDFKTPELERGLSREHFDDFNAYVAKYSSKRGMIRLKLNLNWLKPDADYERVNYKNQELVVPKAFDIKVPKSALGKWWFDITGQNAHIEYFAEKQHLLAERRLASVEVDAEDLSKGLIQLDRLKQNAESITNELNHLKKSYPKGFLSGVFQSAEKNQIKAYRDHWKKTLQNSVTQALSGLARLLSDLEEQAGDEEFELTDAHFECVAQVEALCDRAEWHDGLTDEQKTLLDTLKVDFNSIIEIHTPAWVRLSPLIEELRQGQLTGGGHFQDLEDHIMKLNIKDDRAATNSFMRHCQGVGEGLWPIAEDLLGTLRSGINLDEAETAQLARAVYWGLALEPNYFKPTLEAALETLQGSYWRELSYFPELNGDPWFTQVENVLITLNNKFIASDTSKERAERVNQEQKNRLENPEKAQDAAKKAYGEYVYCNAKKECLTAKEDLTKTLWNKIDGFFSIETKGCKNTLQKIVSATIKKGVEDIREVALTQNQKNLLITLSSNPEHIMYLNLLAQIGQFDVDAADAENLKKATEEMNIKREQIVHSVRDAFRLFQSEQKQKYKKEEQAGALPLDDAQTVTLN